MVHHRLQRTFAHLFHPRRSNNHRPKVLHPESIGVLACLAVLFVFAVKPGAMALAQQTGQVLGYATSINASEVVAKTNAERARAGLPALAVNEKLNQAATAKAQHMFDHQYWSHIAPDGTEPWYFFRKVKYSYRVAGENLARDFNTTDEMVSAWMASPTHKANMVNNKYSEIGVAVVNGQLLGSETTLVVQLFGSPLSTLPTQPNQAGKLPATKSVLGENTAESAKVATSLKVDVSPDLNAEQIVTPVEVPETTFLGENPENSQNRTGTNATAGNANPSPLSEILGAGVLPLSKLETPPLFSPLQLTKAFFLAMIFVLMSTLMYDTVVIGHRDTMRLVGKNFAHFLFFLMAAFLIIYFKAGVVG